MRDFNRIILLGRLGADPVRRETKNGTPVTHFSLATSRKTSASVEEVQWHQIVVWGKAAENCSRFLGKGNGVLVEGSIRTRSYRAKDGTPRTAVEVHADQVTFVTGRKPEQVSAPEEPAAQAPDDVDLPIEAAAAETQSA